MCTFRRRTKFTSTVECEPHVQYELADEFTFEVPQASQFMSAYKKRYWDGKIKLFSPGTGRDLCWSSPLYCCVLRAKGVRSYTSGQRILRTSIRSGCEFVTPEGVGDFVKSLNLPHTS